MHLINTVAQCFRTHRLFQLLSWIDALSRGYDAPGNRRRPAKDSLINEPHRTPTISNLGYYLLTDAEYNRVALKKKFYRGDIRGTPSKEVFTYVKRDLTRHLTQYPGDLFTIKTVRKTEQDHQTFDTGLESRQVKAKAYYLAKHGRDRLEKLTDVMQFKQELITTKKTKTRKDKSIAFIEKTRVLTDDAVDRIVGKIDSKPIETDSITVPVEQRRRWKTKTYWLPHVDVVDADRNQVPTIYRD